MRILLSELMPNIMNNLIVVATLEVAHAILLEAALSFLGMGVQPPLPSWGLMIAEGKEVLAETPHVSLIPATVMFLTVLSFNLLGDRIRELSDNQIYQ